AFSWWATSSTGSLAKRRSRTVWPSAFTPLSGVIAALPRVCGETNQTTLDEAANARDTSAEAVIYASAFPSFLDPLDQLNLEKGKT
ncbi:MAG: hypothetical protein KBE22_16325, partial [Candidatus Accumulibacter sp.]|nr:hypothetical protein [Accumulibacter sp.]